MKRRRRSSFCPNPPATPVSNAETKTAEPKEKERKKPDFFDWFFKTPTSMEAAVMSLPKMMKSMPRTTKLRIEVPGRVSEVTSIIYNPGTDTLTFRGFD